jgi:hypothetical protein
LNQFVVAIGWTIATSLALIVLLGYSPYYDKETSNVILPELLLDPFVRIGFGTLNRPLFALAVAWLIFACTQHYGGI